MRQRQPSAPRRKAHQVIEKHQQIVGVPRDGRHGFAVHDLEIDQPGGVGCRIVNDIPHRRVAVRPGAVEFLAPHAVRSAEFVGRRFHHLSPQRPIEQVIAKTRTGQAILHDFFIAERKR